MVVTEGDAFAELIAREGLGVVVAERDVSALADALETVLFDVEFGAAAREAIARVRQRFVWETTLEPLVAFVRSPHRAADARERSARLGTAARPPRAKTRKPYGLRHNVALVVHHLRHGGIAVVSRKILARLRAR